MKAILFVYGLTAYVCLSALFRPHVGMIGYFGFAVLCPQWNWRWNLPPETPFQKYIAACTLIGFAMAGFSGNRFTGTALLSVASLAGYYVLCLLSATRTIDPEMTQFFMTNIWKIVLMTILAVKMLDSPQKIIACIWVMIIAQGYNAYRVNEFYLDVGFIRIDSFQWNFLDNNTYTVSTMPVMGLATSMILLAPKTWQKLGAGAVFVMQAHQIMILQSRGCMIAAILLALLIIIFMPKTPWTITSLVCGALVIYRLAGPAVIEEFNSAFKSQGELDSSAESRYKLWKAGWQITKDYPLLGAGPHASQVLVPSYYEGGLNEDKDRKALHNLFFEVSTGTGIPAIICYVSFYWSVWFAHLALAWRRWKQLPNWMQSASLGILAGTPAYWLSSMFSSGALIETSYACSAVGAASLLVYAREVEFARAVAMIRWRQPSYAAPPVRALPTA